MRRRGTGPNRRSNRAESRSLDALLAREARRGGVAAPIESITPPSPTAFASERTGSHLSVRISVVGVVVLALFTVLVVRLWSLQVLDGSKAVALALDNTTRTIVLQPPRGDIVARDGQVLAKDVAVEQVLLAKNDESAFVVNELAALLGVSAATIDQAFQDDQYSPYTPIPVPAGAAGVTDSDVQYIEQHPADFPGVTVANGYQRSYPYGSLGSQVIGYTAPITDPELTFPAYVKAGYTANVQVGQVGLEEAYELALHGTPGEERVEVDASGSKVQNLSSQQPVRGDTLVTNLSEPLEAEIQSAILNELPTIREDIAGDGGPAPWAAAVVMDADTGAVYGMASYPYYDDNDWTDGGISEQQYKALLDNPAEPLNNYAIQGLQPPGSTFKLTTATAALDDGLISPGETIDDPGYFQLGNQTFYDTAESSGAGPIDVTQAITMSNDIFFYQLGAWFWYDQSRFGPTPIQDMAKRYGLGTTTGVDLPDAATGQLDSPKLRIEQHRENPQAYPYATYEPGDNVEMAFGQGETLVDPIQLAQAYATFANGGTRYAPEIGAELVNAAGKVVHRVRPKVLGHVPLPASTYEPMLAGFQGVVQSSDGTAYADFQGFNFNAWNLYGKTGTATVSTNDNIAPTAWFVGFGGPKSGPPRYVVVVEVDEGGYGADAAAPIARQIFNFLYAHPISATPTGP